MWGNEALEGCDLLLIAMAMAMAMAMVNLTSIVNGFVGSFVYFVVVSPNAYSCWAWLGYRIVCD